MKILFSATDANWTEYRTLLPAALAAEGLKADLARDHAPETVDYIVYAPGGGLSDFSPYTNARAVLSLWAGVEKIVGNATLTQPLTRMVDSGLEAGMTEYVTGHVLRYHLGMDAHIVNPARVWDNTPPPLARDRKVGLLGLGELGTAAARALAALGFDVAGWARRAREIEGVTTLSGPEGLDALLDRSEILVLLLPLTAETENLLNAERLARLPTGARIINPGRGALIDDDGMLAALDTGQIAHATLDVFRVEPLPQDHPYWAHPNVTITPHIASDTRPATAAEVIADNIARAERGAPLRFLVDRGTGY